MHCDASVVPSRGFIGKGKWVVFVEKAMYECTRKNIQPIDISIIVPIQFMSLLFKKVVPQYCFIYLSYLNILKPSENGKLKSTKI